MKESDKRVFLMALISRDGSKNRFSSGKLGRFLMLMLHCDDPQEGSRTFGVVVYRFSPKGHI